MATIGLLVSVFCFFSFVVTQTPAPPTRIVGANGVVLAKDEQFYDSIGQFQIYSHKTVFLQVFDEYIITVVKNTVTNCWYLKSCPAKACTTMLTLNQWCTMPKPDMTFQIITGNKIASSIVVFFANLDWTKPQSDSYTAPRSVFMVNYKTGSNKVTLFDSIVEALAVPASFYSVSFGGTFYHWEVGNPTSLAITSRSFDGAVKKTVPFTAGAAGLYLFARAQNLLYFINSDATPDKIDALVYPYDLTTETWGASFVITGPTSDYYGITPDGKFIFYVIGGASQLINTYDIAAKTQKELIIAPSIVNDQLSNLYVTDKYFVWMCKCTGPYQWKAVPHALDAPPTVIFTGSPEEAALDYGNPNSAIENDYDKTTGYLVWRAQLASGQGYKLYSYKLDTLTGAAITLENSPSRSVAKEIPFTIFENFVLAKSRASVTATSWELKSYKIDNSSPAVVQTPTTFSSQLFFEPVSGDVLFVDEAQGVMAFNLIPPPPPPPPVTTTGTQTTTAAQTTTGQTTTGQTTTGQTTTGQTTTGQTTAQTSSTTGGQQTTTGQATTATSTSSTTGGQQTTTGQTTTTTGQTTTGQTTTGQTTTGQTTTGQTTTGQTTTGQTTTGQTTTGQTTTGQTTTGSSTPVPADVPRREWRVKFKIGAICDDVNADSLIFSLQNFLSGLIRSYKIELFVNGFCYTGEKRQDAPSGIVQVNVTISGPDTEPAIPIIDEALKDETVVADTIEADVGFTVDVDSVDTIGSDGSLSGGAIAGIVIVAVIGTILLVAAIVFFTTNGKGFEKV